MHRESKALGNREVPRWRQDGSCWLLGVSSRAQEADSVQGRTVLPHGSATRVLVYGPTLPLNGQSLFLFSCSSLCPHPGLRPTLPGQMIPTSTWGCHVSLACTGWGKHLLHAGRRDGGMHPGPGMAGRGNVPASSSTGFCCPEFTGTRSCGEPSRNLLGQHLTGWGRKRYSSIYPGWWDIGDP